MFVLGQCSEFGVDDGLYFSNVCVFALLLAIGQHGRAVDSTADRVLVWVGSLVG